MIKAIIIIIFIWLFNHLYNQGERYSDDHNLAGVIYMIFSMIVIAKGTSLLLSMI